MKKTIAAVLVLIALFSCSGKVARKNLENSIYIRTLSGYSLIIKDSTEIPYTWESRIQGNPEGMEITLAQFLDGEYKVIFKDTVAVEGGDEKPIIRVDLHSNGRAAISVLDPDGNPVKVFRDIVFY